MPHFRGGGRPGVLKSGAPSVRPVALVVMVQIHSLSQGGGDPAATQLPLEFLDP